MVYAIRCIRRLERFTVREMEVAPRKFGDALNDWFHTLGRTWKPLLLSSLAVHVPLGVIVMFVFWMTGAADYFLLYLDPDLEDLPIDEVLEALGPLLWTVAIWSILQIPAGVFVYLAGARAVAGDKAASPFSTGEVSRFAASRTPMGVAWAVLVALAAALLLGVATGVGWVLISAGGANFLTVFVTTVVALTALVLLAWLGLSVSLGLPIIAMEGLGAVEAITRSYLLVQGRWWVTFGYLALSGVIVSAASQVVGIVLLPVYFVGVFVPEVMALVFGASIMLQGLLLVAVGAAYAIWYLDLRARRETVVAEELVAPKGV